MAITQTAKERAFQVMLCGLSEEKRVCGMDDAEYSRRYRDAFNDCFGGGPATGSPQDERNRT